MKQNEFPTLTAEHMKHCVTLASRIDALEMIPRGGVIAEVGVAYGSFSQILINKLKPKKFHAIDIFGFEFGKKPWGYHELNSDLSHEEYYRKKFLNKINDGTVEINKGLSWDILASFDDNYFDYIYVDAGHSYDDVSKDIENLKNKVKRGGYIQFNDYTPYDHFCNLEYGVIAAANKFIIDGGHNMVALCLEPNGFYDILVKIMN